MCEWIVTSTHTHRGNHTLQTHRRDESETEEEGGRKRKKIKAALS